MCIIFAFIIIIQLMFNLLWFLRDMAHCVNGSRSNSNLTTNTIDAKEMIVAFGGIVKVQQQQTEALQLE